MSSVLVTGATGHLGSLLVPRLLIDGHQVRTISRTPSSETGEVSAPHRLRAFTCDLTDATSLAGAVDGVDAVVHCASDPRRPELEVTIMTNLVHALKRSGKHVHLIYISIVGVDALPWSYYRAKYDAERIVETAELPWTIQRATQFHAFIDTTLGQLARSPVMAVPRGFAFQPIATEEVVDRLAGHVEHGAAGRAKDLGGPEVLPAKELARSWLKAHHRHRLVVAVPVPGKLGTAFRSGANLCPDGDRGRLTWQDNLAAKHPDANAVTESL